MDLSVVIPSYRSAGTIRRTIDSAIAEGVPPENIIVVEDGVFDATASVVADCPGVRLVTREVNGGAASARNVGLERVTTKYVMFLDADDYVENGLLRGLVGVLERDSSEIAIGPWRYDGEGRRQGMVRVPEDISNDEWIRRWILPIFFPPCSVVWKTESVRRIGAWDERLKTNDDGEIMIRAFLRGLKVSVSKTGNSIYWQHYSPYRVSFSKIDDLIHATEIIVAQLEGWAAASRSNPSTERYRNALGRYCCVTAWNAFAHDRAEAGVHWRARARDFGFRHKGYSPVTSFLAAFLGIRLSSKVKTCIVYPGSFYKAISQR